MQAGLAARRSTRRACALCVLVWASLQADAQGLPRVASVRLRYTWQEVVDDLDALLHTALGPEIAYWRRRSPTCSDLAATVSALHSTAPDTVRVLLLRNGTLHLLVPRPPGPAAAPQGSARAHHAWPPLQPTPPGFCLGCHAQLAALARRLGASLGRPLVPGGPVGALPDLVAVLSAADNFQRRGRGARAPLLSLQKWWPADEGRWWAPADAATGLGRAGGRLLQQPPRRVASAAAAASGGTSPTGAAPGALEAAVERLWARLDEGRTAAAGAAAGGSGGGGGGDGAVVDAEVAAGLERGALDPDLLLPNMAVVPTALYAVPWQEAADTAFFSGSPFCARYNDTHGGAVCLRALLAVLAKEHPADLDARLVAPYEGPLGGPLGTAAIRLPAVPPTPLRDHSRYRFVLAPDGYSGSYRMGGLMAGSSLILKSKSPFIEWYSRLLLPGAHYAAFWEDPTNPADVLGALAQLRRAAEADPDGRFAAVGNCQQLAARYLGPEPRLAYAHAALRAYVRLFDGRMAGCVEDLLAHLEQSGAPLRPGVPGVGW